MRRARHYDELVQVRARMVGARDAIEQAASQADPATAEAIRAALSHLVRSFGDLWEMSGHDLPVDKRDYAAGVIDELRRQTRKQEKQGT